MRQTGFLALGVMGAALFGQVAAGQAVAAQQKTSAGGTTNSSNPHVVVFNADGSVEKIVTDGGLPLIVPTFEPGLRYEDFGCPVHIVSASFARPPQFMLTTEGLPPSSSATEEAPSLRLDYRNLSGKDIASVLLTGYIRLKESPYQLDSVSHAFSFELSQKVLLGKNVEASQALKLTKNALGLDRIELAQVIYADGSAWKPDPHQKCVYHAGGTLERAEAR